MKNLSDIFDELFPINRSITGRGYRKSLNILKKYINLKNHDFKSGSRVFDWRVPPEWNVNEAYLIRLKDKKIILDFKKNNLHVMGYSEPVDTILSKNQLVKNLFYIKDKPNLIPYMTSYYKRQWGLCLSYNQFKKYIKPGNYKVVIKSSFSKGFLRIGTGILKGRSKKY